jgi:Uma2 family endonuclease
MAMPVPPYRFTIEEYEQMGAVGILPEDARVELIQGEVVAMSPVGDRHYDSVLLLNRLLNRQVPDDLGVAVQSPVRLPSDSEPEPDIVIVRIARATPGVPTVRDVLLVIEVSDSTRDYDYGVKVPLYGAAGIREMWLVDLNAGHVDRYTEPYEGGYHAMRRFVQGQTVTSDAVATIAVPVGTALGLLA